LSLLQTLSGHSSRLTKAAGKIAEVVLADPDWVIDSAIAQLALRAGVSEPSVNRFCRAIGCRGFPDFKVRLAQELAKAQPASFAQMTPAVDANDTMEHVISKIFDATHASLAASRTLCDSRLVEQAVDLLTQARSILFYGLGASGSVAIDAQHKFLRFDIPVIAHVDNLNQRMTAAGLSAQDVAVCISYTGRTKALVEVAEIARRSGAAVLGITNANSPLAKQCQLTLAVDAAENTDLYTPMTSRLDHLVLIDILATGFALKRRGRLQDNFRKTSEVLKATRTPNADG